MDLKIIDYQPWSSLVADHVYCPKCLVLNRDLSLGVVGTKCKHCGHKSDGAHFYFSQSIFGLIDLIQDFFILSPDKLPPSDDIPANFYEPTKNNQFAIIIFFCTLGEVLLHNLLDWIMNVKSIPKNVQDRLFEDNLYAKQRTERLFPALVNEKWKYAVNDLSKNSELDYESTVSFYLDVIETRNNLLHRGKTWSLPLKMSDKCIDHI